MLFSGVVTWIVWLPVSAPVWLKIGVPPAGFVVGAENSRKLNVAELRPAGTLGTHWTVGVAEFTTAAGAE